MSFKIAVIGDRDTAIGFALAGATYTHVHVEKESTLSKLTELLAARDVGVLLITHRVAEGLEPELRWVMREKGVFPVVLKIPDKTGHVPRVDELLEVIRRTVGAEVVVRAEAG